MYVYISNGIKIIDQHSIRNLFVFILFPVKKSNVLDYISDTTQDDDTSNKWKF